MPMTARTTLFPGLHMRARRNGDKANGSFSICSLGLINEFGFGFGFGFGLVSFNGRGDSSAGAKGLEQ
jgi:hypothetical protein